MDAYVVDQPQYYRGYEQALQGPFSINDEGGYGAHNEPAEVHVMGDPYVVCHPEGGELHEAEHQPHDDGGHGHDQGVGQLEGHQKEQYGDEAEDRP